MNNSKFDYFFDEILSFSDYEGFSQYVAKNKIDFTSDEKVDSFIYSELSANHLREEYRSDQNELNEYVSDKFKDKDMINCILVLFLYFYSKEIKTSKPEDIDSLIKTPEELNASLIEGLIEQAKNEISKEIDKDEDKDI